MKPQKAVLVCLLAIFLLSGSIQAATVNPTYALKGCRIYPVSGPVIEDGLIIIRDGKIEAVGPVDSLEIPPDAQVIEAEELFAYPGLIDAYTGYFLKQEKKETPRRPGFPASGEEERNWDKTDFSAWKNLDVKKALLDSIHRTGVTTVLVVPPENIFAGRSVLLNLNGTEITQMILKDSWGMHVYFTNSRGSYPSSLMGTMALLRQSLLDAGYYLEHLKLFQKDPKKVRRPYYDPFLENIISALTGKEPLVFDCSNLEDIKRAVRLVDEFKLKAVLAGANEGWRVVDWLKKAKLPLLVSLNFEPPSTSRYANMGEELKKKAKEEIYPANAANLHKEGIRFALVSAESSKPGDYLKNIRLAIKAGLPEEEALKSVTIHPARILGIESLLGTIEPGKIANIVLTEGEIFKDNSKIKMVFVDGIKFEVKEPPKGKKEAAVNISGKWSAKIDSPMGTMDTVLEFQQTGNQVSGTISSEMGEWEITDGLLSENNLSFTIQANIMGESMELAFEGTATQEKIEGTINFAGGSAELQASRIPDQGN